MPKYECANCEYETDNDQDFKFWNEIHHLGERLDVGGIVPAGECPECGCLVYLNEHPVPYRDIVSAAHNVLSLLEAEGRDTGIGGPLSDLRDAMRQHQKN